MQTATHARHGDAPPPALPDRLDDLLALEARDLRLLYEAAYTPKLTALSGSLRGRILALPGVHGLPAAAMRAFARSSAFPWRGKTFRHTDERHGMGDNRLFADRFHAWRYATSIGPSRAGAFDAVHLDYDQPGNPFYVRRIRDELRELRPGLYLGQAYLLLGAPRLFLYFGLEG
jgi:hypothetical protein